VCIVSDRALPADTAAGMPDLSIQLTREGESLDAACHRAAVAALLTANPCPAVLVFLDGRASLTDQTLAQSLRAFEGTPSLGVLSGWVRETGAGGHLRIQSSPSLPHLWHDGGIVPYVAVRALAYLESSAATSSNTDQVLQYQMLDRISRAGWSVVTYPAVLVSIALTHASRSRRRSRPRYSSMARGVQRLHMPIFQWLRECSPEDRRALIRDGLSTPLRSIQWLTARAWRFLRAPIASRSAETL